ncbi:MAG: hypothetical protein KDE63_10640 [Novosphingobium sp.]|nr:hypothetical protein [Novosphingobium sp.]
MRYVPWAYAVICIAAFIILALGSPALAGGDADPLSGVFVFLLSLPWILLTDLFGEVSLVVIIVCAIGAMLLNFLILRRLVRRFHPRVSKGDQI